MPAVLLSLGSNIGNLPENLRSGIEAIGNIAGLRVTSVSSFHQTKAWGNENQPDFLNAALSLETNLQAMVLLKAFQQIETSYGRDRNAPRWSPRVLDIDILFYGNQILEEPGLKIPHPLCARRLFVLAPLAEIAPDFKDPSEGKSISELLAELEKIEAADVKGGKVQCF